MIPPRPAAEDGSILPLLIGFAALALALVLVATDVTSLYLERQRLLSVADGAALAASESFPVDASTGQAAPHPALRDGDVREDARGYLAALPGPRPPGLRLDRAWSPDGSSASVRVSAVWRPPVVTLVVPVAVSLTVTSNARGVFRAP